MQINKTDTNQYNQANGMFEKAALIVNDTRRGNELGNTAPIHIEQSNAKGFTGESVIANDPSVLYKTIERDDNGTPSSSVVCLTKSSLPEDAYSIGHNDKENMDEYASAEYIRYTKR